MAGTDSYFQTHKNIDSLIGVDSDDYDSSDGDSAYDHDALPSLLDDSDSDFDSGGPDIPQVLSALGVTPDKHLPVQTVVKYSNSDDWVWQHLKEFSNAHNDSKHYAIVNFSEPLAVDVLDQHLFRSYQDTNIWSKTLYHNMLASKHPIDGTCTSVGESERNFKFNYVYIEPIDLLFVESDSVSEEDRKQVKKYITSNMSLQPNKDEVPFIVAGIPSDEDKKIHSAIAISVVRGHTTDTKFQRMKVMVSKYFQEMMRSPECKLIPTTLSMVVQGGGHDIFFYVDKRTKTIKIFDSNGPTPVVRSVLKIALYFVSQKYQPDGGGVYTIEEAGLGEFSCQYNIIRSDTWSGSCQMWSQIIRDLHVTLPDKEVADAVLAIQSLTYDKSIDLVRAYSAMRCSHIFRTIFERLFEKLDVVCGPVADNFGAPGLPPLPVKYSFDYNWITGVFTSACKQTMSSTNFYLSKHILFYGHGNLIADPLTPQFLAVVITPPQKVMSQTVIKVSIPGNKELPHLPRGEFTVYHMLTRLKTQLSESKIDNRGFVSMMAAVMPVLYSCLVQFQLWEFSNFSVKETPTDFVEKICGSFIRCMIVVAYPNMKKKARKYVD